MARGGEHGVLAKGAGACLAFRRALLYDTLAAPKAASVPLKSSEEGVPPVALCIMLSHAATTGECRPSKSRTLEMISARRAGSGDIKGNSSLGVGWPRAHLR